MLHVFPTKKSDLNKAVNDYFTAFKADILTSTSKQWNEEDNRGTSLKQWHTMKYYSLLYLLIMVYQEVQRTLNLNYPWSYYVEKFQLEKYKKCLACMGIDIDKGYEAFKFGVLVPTGGVGLQGVAYNLLVYPSSPVICSTTVKELLETPSYCINIIAGDEVPQGNIDEEATCDNFDTIQDIGPLNDDEIID